MPPPTTDAGMTSTVDGPSNCVDATSPKRIAEANDFTSLRLRGRLLVVATGDDMPANGSVRIVDLADGSTRTLASDRADPGTPSLSARFAYWLDVGTTDMRGALQLVRAPLDGSSPPEHFADANIGPTDTLVDGDTIYFGHVGSLASISESTSTLIDLVKDDAPLELATAGDFVYWSACNQLQRAPKSGGAPSHIADGSCIIGLATDASDVFFVDWPGPPDAIALRRVPLAGGTPVTLASPSGPSTSRIAVDDANAYFSNEDGLRRVPKIGGASEMFAAGKILDVAVDASCVYWADAEQKAVFVQRK